MFLDLNSLNFLNLDFHRNPKHRFFWGDLIGGVEIFDKRFKEGICAATCFIAGY